MNLPQGDERPGLPTRHCAEVLQEGSSVAFYRRARVLLGESKIESVLPIGPGESSRPRTESMNQPGNGSEAFRLENVYPLLSGILWHNTILEQATLPKIMLRATLRVVCANTWPAHRRRQAVELCLPARAGL